MPSQRLPVPGEPAPLFTGRTSNNPDYHFDTVAGRYVVLCFLGSASAAFSKEILSLLQFHRSLFDDENIAFFGVSVDPEDERLPRITDQLPGIRFLWDFDGNISQRYGRIVDNVYEPLTVVLDERLRVYASLRFTGTPQAHIASLVALLASAPLPGRPGVVAGPAPILVIPRVFEPALCQRLMEYYEAGGEKESGFMRDVDGKTVGHYDHKVKSRRDKEIDDMSLRQACMARIHRRVAPEIARAFQFNATRMERHIVACYDAAAGGHFRPHRDNTTRGTAHRRFAVSVVLNTGEFEGGQLRFPEYAKQCYEPPAGGAVVFSCSILHEATPITQGRRYVYLPFLYDDAAAALRERNAAALAPGRPDGEKPVVDQPMAE